MADLVGVNSRVDWGAIFAGAVLTTAIALILLTFGGALGLGVTSPYEGEGVRPALYVFGAGLWLLWVQLASFTIGGYVTARLRARQPDATEHEVDVRDGLHGLLTWGVGVIAAATIAFAGIGGVTAAAENSDGRGDLIGAVAASASQEVDDAAAQEAATNPEAADESLLERRAEMARRLMVISAFITAASLLAGAAAAFYAAGLGGKHRDQNTQLTFFVIRR
jgi:hypothetical protein